MARQIADALGAAHDQGVIHRDLKLANIKLKPDGTVKVLDFGLAKAVDSRPQAGPAQSSIVTTPGTRLGTILGAPGYMSPEQVRGEALDGQSDLFAFGTLLYEVLSGVHPFQRPTPVQTMSAILEHDPPWEDGRLDEVPNAMQLMLRKLLAKKPGDRYASVTDLRRNLVQLRNEPATVPDAIQAAAAATAVPSHRATFVGRDAELGELREALDRLAAGQGSVVLVGDEPGVGKTRLIEEVVWPRRRRAAV